MGISTLLGGVAGRRPGITQRSPLASGFHQEWSWGRRAARECAEVPAQRGLIVVVETW